MTPCAPVLRAAHPLVVMRLAGDQPAMGAQHGRFAAERGGCEETFCFYPGMPQRTLLHADRSAATRLLLRAAQPLLDLALDRLQRRRQADYTARSRSFFEAVGRPARDARYTMVMDLLQNVIGLAGRFGLGPFARRLGHAVGGQCSSMTAWGAATTDGRLLHARNFDFPGIGIWEQRPAVVFATPDDGLRYGFVTTLGADAPGVTGFNEAGITLSSHTRFHRDVSFDGRAIIDLCHDVIRRAQTLDDAVAIVRERPSASSWGLLISSAAESSARHLEITSKGVAAHAPPSTRPTLWCANRYHDPALAAGEVTPSPAFAHYSDGREQVMARHLADAVGLDVADLQRLLGSHEPPDAPGTERAAGSVLAQTISVQSVVNDPERQTTWVSVGDCPTGKGPWLAVPWRWDDQPGVDIVDAPPAPAADTASRFSRGRAAAGYAAFLDAARVDNQGGARADVAAAMNLALHHSPDEADYHTIAGGLACQQRAWTRALRHLEAAIAHEPSPFRRGELRLWAARVADAAGARETARRHRARLADTPGALLGEARHQAQRDARRRYPARKLAGLTVDFQLLTLG